MEKILIRIITILIIIIAFLIIRTGRDRAINKLLEESNETLLSSFETYKTKKSLNAIKTQRLVMDRDDLKENYPNLIEMAKDAGIKPKRIKSISDFATTTRYEIVTKIRDSVVYIDTIKCFNYQDPWLKASGCIRKDTILLSYKSQDTLVQIISRVPKKFWFIRYGTKGFNQTIISKNPNTEFEYSRYIEVK